MAPAALDGWMENVTFSYCPNQRGQQINSPAQMVGLLAPTWALWLCAGCRTYFYCIVVLLPAVFPLSHQAMFVIAGPPSNA